MTRWRSPFLAPFLGPPVVPFTKGTLILPSLLEDLDLLLWEE